MTSPAASTPAVPRPKVSVCVITYKQEKYIAQCLQSLVDQQTDFPFEIIVGDDCSPDGTAAIIQDFAQRYPHIITPVLHTKNLGPTGNYFSVHNKARGDYVCHLDGDDYALAGKLQALADHLDRHDDCVIVWHRMQILTEDGRMAVGMPLTPITSILGKERLYAKDLALYYGITGCHSGSMYRRAAKKLSAIEGEILDYYVTLSLCEDGGCAMYIEQPFGVYRFFLSDATLTKVKGGVIVGSGKLRVIEDYRKKNIPGLRQRFVSQCLFEMILRGFFGNPLKLNFASALLRCAAFPDVIGFINIWRIFLRNRSAKLMAALR